jgi:carbonic anhydrase/acetyltransferase-like protein (isoleucine patch superfamily)
MPVLAYLEHRPRLGAGVELGEGAYAIGKVAMAGPARLEAGAVVRGDQNEIEVGPRFRMGARSTVHVEVWSATRIGANVWVGEGAVVHACTLGDGVRVEDGGLVLSGSSVGGGSVVARGSLVSEGASFPENSYIAGTPGRRQRDTTEEERAETLRLLDEALGQRSD